MRIAPCPSTHMCNTPSLEMCITTNTSHLAYASMHIGNMTPFVQ